MRLILACLLVAGCETPEEFGPSTCEGGGEPRIEIGTGGRNSFVGFEPGQSVRERNNGLTMDLFTSGLNVLEPVTTVVRIAADGGGTEDSLASVSYQCTDSGNGWTTVIANLPQNTNDGSILSIDVVATDPSGTSVSTALEVVFEK